MYYNIWQGATQGTNTYKPFRVDWWDVPGRDEKWKNETVGNTSQLQFDQEFGNSFHGRGNTLINANELLAQIPEEPISAVENLYIYEQPLLNHEYIMTVDVARG